LYSTRVLLDRNQDCDNSFLLPLDSRRDSLHHLVQLNLVHEVYWMPMLDTFFHSQCGSKFPCTHARVQSIYILDKVNINKVNIIYYKHEHLGSAEESGLDPQSVCSHGFGYGPSFYRAALNSYLSSAVIVLS